MRKRRILFSMLALGLCSFALASCGEETTKNVDNPIVSPDSKDDSNDSKEDTKGTLSKVEVLLAKSLKEGAYVTFKKQAWASGYNAYIKESSNSTYSKLDSALIREADNYYRVDALGLKKGNYDIKIVPLKDGVEQTSCEVVETINNVEEYDRSGYAHFNYNEGVGAYNNDGSLKDNAIVLYVTDENKNTVTLTYKGKTVSGIGNILNSVGEECGEAGHEGECKKVASKKTYYGKANTNQGILRDLANDNIPLVVRFIGCVSNTGLYEPGTFDASKASLIEGLTAYNGVDFGGSVGDNGHMARMKSAKNVTLEGVGENAVIDGWGFHLICESAYPTLARNFEVRNLAFINTPEDAIGMEGQQEKNVITAGVERCFIHHNTFIGPKILNAAESDKSEGDGSCDFKRGMYFTCSYNYYEGCHKTNLVGSSDDSLQFNLTYHHNLWYNCSSRMPLLRQANCHFYNNYIIGGDSASYISSLRANSYFFAESNYYEGAKNVIDGLDSGASAKLYNNVYIGTASKFDYSSLIVSNRDALVSANTAYNGISYANFDTNSELFYYDSANKKSDCYLNTASEAKKVCLEESGSLYRTLALKTMIQPNYTMYKYSVSEAINLNEAFNITYPSSKTNGEVNGIYFSNITGITSSSVKFKNVGLTFMINDYAKLNITMTSDNQQALAAGFIVNVNTNELVLSGSGCVILAPGTYAIVSSTAITSIDGQAGKNSKETTVTAFSLTKYDSSETEELKKGLFISSYKNLKNVEFTNNYYTNLIATIKEYDNLSIDNKASLVNEYNTLLGNLEQYKSMLKDYTEFLIDKIGTVNENSGSDIAAAKVAYDDAISKFSDIVISNKASLDAAISAYQEYVVTGTINAIDKIGEVTTLKEELIKTARSLYDSLTDEQKALVTNYETLVEAEATLKSVKKIARVEELISGVALDNLASVKNVINLYESLTDSEKAQVGDYRLSDVKVAYVKLSIDALPTDITRSDAENINSIKAYYDTLTEVEKNKVTNYEKLTEAIDKLSSLPSELRTLTSDFTTGWTITGATSNFSGLASTANSLVAISNDTYADITEITLIAQCSDKGSTSFSVYYSLDGTTWNLISTVKSSKNNKNEELSITVSNVISGNVYLKVVCECSKGASNAKSVSVSSISIKCYN